MCYVPFYYTKFLLASLTKKRGRNLWLRPLIGYNI